MLSGLGPALALTAVLVGATGTWSPCGLSMVETIGPRGHASGTRTTLAACATFALGSLVGAVLTFGSLALLGDLVHGAAGRTAYIVAAVIAAAAALLELRGVPIVPQIRRQLPEHWRRLMPMPLAAALYGVLLGLGFTTFVLTFGVWALAGISAAVGSPELGLVVGLGFGVGRALPIVVVAPAMERPWGIRAAELMAEQPAIYRGFRLGDALALALTALVLTGADSSEAQVAPPPEPPTAAAAAAVEDAADPALAGGGIAFDRSGSGFLRRGGQETRLPGSDPALGGPFVAVRSGDSIRVLRRGDLAAMRTFSAPGADAIAVSSRWLVYRVRVGGGGDRMLARRVSGAGGEHLIARVGFPGQLSRPSLWGRRLAYGVATRRSSRITVRRLGKRGAEIAARGSRRSLLTNPAVRGRDLLYVRTTPTRQQLRLKRVGRRGAGRLLVSRAATSWRDSGHGPGGKPHRHPGRRRRPPDTRRSRFTFWSTALGARTAFLTLLTFSRGTPSPEIVTARR